MVNISYFCRPEPWRNMSSSTCGCWMLLVGLILKCHRLNSTKLHRDTLGIGAVSVKSYWDHTVQVYIRVLITIPPKKTNLSKRVFSLVTSVCTEPRNRKNQVLPKPWRVPLSLPEFGKFLIFINVHLKAFQFQGMLAACMTEMFSQESPSLPIIRFVSSCIKKWATISCGSSTCCSVSLGHPWLSSQS